MDNYQQAIREFASDYQDHRFLGQNRLIVQFFLDGSYRLLTEVTQSNDDNSVTIKFVPRDPDQTHSDWVNLINKLVIKEALKEVLLQYSDRRLTKMNLIQYYENNSDVFKKHLDNLEQIISLDQALTIYKFHREDIVVVLERLARDLEYSSIDELIKDDPRFREDRDIRFYKVIFALEDLADLDTKGREYKL